MTGVILGATLAAAAWLGTGPEFRGVSILTLVSHLPLAVVDGLVTASVVVFLRKVRPELLEAPLLAPATAG
jgi:cobalt/nickel transport system permease protein